MYDLKVTPGEWVIVNILEADPKNSNTGSVRIGVRDKNDTGSIIVYFGDYQDAKTKEEALYNAQLIINAKNLFETLKNISQDCDGNDFSAFQCKIEHSLKEASTI